MRNITYLLGAGFSAPLDIPTMRNFYPRSQKIGYENREHFQKIFEYWSEVSTVKHYAKINMLNIEELLSLLEMENYLKGSRLLKHMQRYIADVVNYHLPGIENNIDSFDKEYLPRDWYKRLFVNEPIKYYGYFFIGLLNLSISKASDFEQWKFKYYKNNNEETRYFVVSLNYDLVFEELEKHLKKTLIEDQANSGSYQPSMLLNHNLNQDKEGFLDLIKLHGSADDPKSIVPPTWNKILSREKSSLWKKAYEFLSNSDEIRVIGYSLPISDVYFRYFLMSCIRSSTRRLKKFQVISLDPHGDVKKNYANFFEQVDFFEFYTVDVVDYLKKVYDSILPLLSEERGRVHFQSLENGHETFIKEFRTRER